MTLYGEQYTDYQLDRNRLRRFVRRYYLDAAIAKLQGPTIDFGCGVGELLHRLPAASIGLEINPASVAYCRERGLDARLYDADADNWSLSNVVVNESMQSLVISHVLEHLEAPMEKLRKLLQGCERLGISRVLVIVPGKHGYESDDTHRTFVDLGMLTDPQILEGTGFSLSNHNYFPGNFRRLGDIFPHHELQATFTRI